MPPMEQTQVLEATSALVSMISLTDALLALLTRNELFALVASIDAATESTRVPRARSILLFQVGPRMLPCQRQRSALDSSRLKRHAQWPVS